MCSSKGTKFGRTSRLEGKQKLGFLQIFARMCDCVTELANKGQQLASGQLRGSIIAPAATAAA